jgi:putative CocE/NonD family hydrolase
VFQDVRGRYQSEGQFVEVRPHIDNPKSGDVDENTDTYDTIEWLLKHVPNNNGKVGVRGMSYPGFFTSASIIDSHPAIKAASIEAPVTNEFEGDDAYRNGAFMLAEEFLFYSDFFKPRTDRPTLPPSNFGHEFDYGTKDGYQYFLQHGPDLADIATVIKNSYFDENVKNNTYDEFWHSRDISQHMLGIKCAVLNVGGWFDAEDLAGTFRTYHAIERNNPGIFNVLVVGPWMHGDWVRSEGKSLGPLDFNSATSDFFREHIAFPFFELYLKGKGDARLPEAYAFETGSNVWRQYDTWPPKNTQHKTIYLHGSGKLSFNPPAANEPAYDEYVSDPAHPVPYVEHPSTELDSEYMYGDQRFAAKRNDVLTYVSDPLPQDVTIVGSVSPHLQVSTSGTDADFDVKLIDVYPEYAKDGGYAQLVRGEPMRAKFRNSKTWDKPEAMVPDQVTPVNFEMQDVNHTFRRGHLIMVQIQSSWFPLTDLNPQAFVDTATAKKSDFVKATQRVYHSTSQASGIGVEVMPTQ